MVLLSSSINGPFAPYPSSSTTSATPDHVARWMHNRRRSERRIAGSDQPGFPAARIAGHRVLPGPDLAVPALNEIPGSTSPGQYFCRRRGWFEALLSWSVALLETYRFLLFACILFIIVPYGCDNPMSVEANLSCDKKSILCYNSRTFISHLIGLRGLHMNIY